MIMKINWREDKDRLYYQINDRAVDILFKRDKSGVLFLEVSYRDDESHSHGYFGSDIEAAKAEGSRLLNYRA